MKSVTVFICHFGDPWWVKFSLLKNGLIEEKSIVEIVIIDNSGNLLGDDFFNHKKITLLPMFSLPGGRIQHAYTLNRVLETHQVHSEYVLILDTDVIGFRHLWLNRIMEKNPHDSSSILVLQEGSGCLTHSCFLIIPTSIVGKRCLNFERGVSVLKFDTARLIGLSLLEAKLDFVIESPKPMFGRTLGYSYFNEFIHITSVSVRQMRSRKLNSKKALSKIRNNFLKEIALNASRLHKLDSKLGLMILLVRSFFPSYKRFSHNYLAAK